MSIVVMMIMIFLMPVMETEAEETEVSYAVTGGNIFFDTSTGTITECESSVTEAIIPDTIAGVSVTHIEEYAFENCNSLCNITIPASVTSIGEFAFVRCSNLSSINVDNNNIVYSSSADGVLFNKNQTILITYPQGKEQSSYVIPISVTTIGDWAFDACSALNSITIPTSVTTIGEQVFSNCDGLISIEIPTSVTTIGDRAFYSCNGLSSIKIPSSVTNIGENAFYYCSVLESIEIPSSITSISKGLFWGCGSLRNIEIPTSVTTIGESAFVYCDSLTEVYYSGNEDDWNKINIGDNNVPLTNATIYYNRTNPDDTEDDSGNIPVTPPSSNDSIAVGNKVEETTRPIKIADIRLQALSNKIAAGKRVKLTASIFPVNASNQRLIWSSSNPKVATVDQSGVVTMKKKTGGKSVIITVTAADGSGTKAAARIKSMEGIIKKVTIDGAKKKTVKAGKKLKLKARVTATKGANKKLIWRSSNTKFATVTASGKVKTKKAGKGKKVKITAMATDESNKKMTVIIKMK